MANKYITNITKIIHYLKIKISSAFVAKESGKGLSSNDFTDVYKNKVDNTPAAADIVTKETGKGLSTNDYTDSDKAKVATIPASFDFSNYVEKETGKGLSSNDYTTDEKTKLANVPTPSTIAVLDANGKVPVANIPPELNALETVATYADLPVTGNFDGRRVMVLNASGDPTVVSGFAIYVYSTTSSQWTKIAESESMDLVVDWTNIQNKPSVENVLTSTSTTNMLSAAQGKALKDLIDAAPTASNVITGVAEGSTNGSVAVTKNGTATDVSVHGLGSAAYTASSDYSASNHTHGNISNDGKIGSTANLPLITTTNGAVTVGSFGNTANSFCEGNDSRLSDARTPTAHTHTQVNGYTISVVSALPASPDSDTIYFVLES